MDRTNPTRRDLLRWLGRGTTLGLFSPWIAACAGGGDGPMDGDAPTGDGVARDAIGGDAIGGDGTPADVLDGCAVDPGEYGDHEVYDRWPVRTADAVQVATALGEWRLEVDGLCDRPRTFDFCALRDLGLVSQLTDFHCVEGWSVPDVPWDGLPLARLLDEVGARPEATWLQVRCIGDRYTESLPVAVAREPRSLLGLGIAGRTLTKAHGFPCRLVVPRLLGYKNAKYVKRITLATTDISGFWEQYGYELEGEVPPERLRPGKY